MLCVDLRTSILVQQLAVQLGRVAMSVIVSVRSNAAATGADSRPLPVRARLLYTSDAAHDLTRF